MASACGVAGSWRATNSDGSLKTACHPRRRDTVRGQLHVGFVGCIHCWRWPAWKLTRLKIGEDQRRPKRKSRPESHGVVSQANGLLRDGLCLCSRGACSS
jgi:hypothetical protein